MSFGASRRGYGYRYEQRQHPPQPTATYWLLGVIVAVFVLELVVEATRGSGTLTYLFTIYIAERHGDWILRPWSPITSTFSHGGFNHLFVNGLFLYFFGSSIENLIGRRQFVTLFIVTGSLSGIAQVELLQLLSTLDSSRYATLPALGASGALMALFGMTALLMPRSKMIIFPLFIPIPVWVAGLFFVLADLTGLASGTSGIGNVAHLSGGVLGILYGLKVKKDMARRGLRLVYA